MPWVEGFAGRGFALEANEALQQQVRDLQRVLGKVALENELLKEAGALRPREAG